MFVIEYYVLKIIYEYLEIVIDEQFVSVMSKFYMIFSKDWNQKRYANFLNHQKQAMVRKWKLCIRTKTIPHMNQ